MSNESAAPKLPLAVIVPVSVGIGFHFFAILIHSIAAPSGPWPTPDGGAMFGPAPRFALQVDSIAEPYLVPLQMTHNYHFFSNRIYEVPSVQLSVTLKDKNGRTIQTLKYPDPEASIWVRHRQTLLAQALFEDRSGPRPGAARVYPRDAEIPRVYYWGPDVERQYGIALEDSPPAKEFGLDTGGGVKVMKIVPGKGADRAGLRVGDIMVNYRAEGLLNKLEDADHFRRLITDGAPGSALAIYVIRKKKDPDEKKDDVTIIRQRFSYFTLKNAPENELPRIELSVPSDRSAVLARSYVRLILNQTNAASAEIIRTSRPPIFAIAARPENEMNANFGDGSPRR